MDLETNCALPICTQQITNEGYAVAIEPNSYHPVILCLKSDSSSMVLKPSPNLRKIIKNGPIENGKVLQTAIINPKSRTKQKKEVELTMQDLIATSTKVMEELYPQ